MLQHFGAGDGAVFVHMSYHDGWNVQRFTAPQYGIGTLSYLRYTARRGIQLRKVHGLNGIDHHQIRLLSADFFRHILDISFRHNQKIFCGNTQSSRPKLNLSP